MDVENKYEEESVSEDVKRVKSNELSVISPSAGDGDVNQVNRTNQHTEDGNSSGLSGYKTEISNQAKTKSLWASLSRFVKPSNIQEQVSNDTTIDVQKLKRYSLGKMFRQGQGSGANAKHKYCEGKNEAPVEKALVKSTEQTCIKSLGVLFGSLRGNISHSNHFPFNIYSKENMAELPKQRTGSLGRFFQYRQGRRTDIQETSSHSSPESTSSMFVTLPLDHDNEGKQLMKTDETAQINPRDQCNHEFHERKEIN